jgi:transcription termination factor Rho
LRRSLTDLPPVDGTRKLVDLLEEFPTNAELLKAFSPA